MFGRRKCIACIRRWVYWTYVTPLCTFVTVEHDGVHGRGRKRHKEQCRKKKKKEAGKHHVTRIPLSTEYRDQYKKWPIVTPDKVGLVAITLFIGFQRAKQKPH